MGRKPNRRNPMSLFFEGFFYSLKNESEEEVAILANWNLTTRQLHVQWTGPLLTENNERFLRDFIWLHKLKGIAQVTPNSVTYTIEKMTAPLNRNFEGTVLFLNEFEFYKLSERVTQAGPVL